MPGTFDRTRGRALTREVSPLFSDAVTEFFGTKAPDYAAALGAQEAYFAALRAHGTDVVTLPALDGYPDCSFTEDTAVMIDGKAIVTNLGHPSRRGEQDSVAEFLRQCRERVAMLRYLAFVVTQCCNKKIYCACCKKKIIISQH